MYWYGVSPGRMCVSYVYKYNIYIYIIILYFLVYPGRICENHIFGSNCWHNCYDLWSWWRTALEHWKRCQWVSRWRGGAPQASSLDVRFKKVTQNPHRNRKQVSSFSGNFNLQPSQDIPSVVLIIWHNSKLHQSEAKEHHKAGLPQPATCLHPSLLPPAAPLALSRRIGFIGPFSKNRLHWLQTAWDSSLAAKRFGCKLLGCKRTGLALNWGVLQEHFRHLFPVSNTNSSMGFVE